MAQLEANVTQLKLKLAATEDTLEKMPKPRAKGRKRGKSKARATSEPPELAPFVLPESLPAGGDDSDSEDYDLALPRFSGSDGAAAMRAEMADEDGEGGNDNKMVRMRNYEAEQCILRLRQDIEAEQAKYAKTSKDLSTAQEECESVPASFLCALHRLNIRQAQQELEDLKKEIQTARATVADLEQGKTLCETKLSLLEERERAYVSEIKTLKELKEKLQKSNKDKQQV